MLYVKTVIHITCTAKTEHLNLPKQLCLLLKCVTIRCSESSFQSGKHTESNQ